MNTEQFAVWLHGFFELTYAEELTKGQVKMIKEHLDLCFDKKTQPLKEKTTLDPIWDKPIFNGTCLCGLSYNSMCPLHGSGLVTKPSWNNPPQIIC